MSESEPVAALPWERQPGETSSRYKLFQAYLAAGWGRTLQDAATAAHRSYDHVRKIAAEQAWADRAAAYDDHLLERFADQWIDKCLQAFQRDEALLRMAWKKASHALTKLDLTEARVGDVARLIDVVLRQSRLLYGDPYKTLAGVDLSSVDGEGVAEAADSEFARLPKEARDRVLSEMRAVIADRAHARSGADDD